MSPNKAAGIFISYTLSENHCGHFSCNLIHYVLFNDFEQKYYLKIRQEMYIFPVHGTIVSGLVLPSKHRNTKYISYHFFPDLIIT